MTCRWPQMLALLLFSSFWTSLQCSILWIITSSYIIYTPPSVYLILFIHGFHPTSLGELSMLPWETHNSLGWHTTSPVVSFKAQCSAPPCLYSICSPSAVSSAGMEFNFTAMLMKWGEERGLNLSWDKFNPSNPSSAALPSFTLTTCLEEIKAWMKQNFLLNCSKTDAILVGTPHQIWTSDIPSIIFSDQDIPLSTSVTNLGVKMDSHLTFDVQVKHLCKTSLFYLRNIAKLCLALTCRCGKSCPHICLFQTGLLQCAPLWQKPSEAAVHSGQCC